MKKKNKLEKRQFIKEVKAIFDSHGIVSKAEKARPNVEQMVKDFTELSEIIRKANNCPVRSSNYLLKGVLASAANRLEEANANALKALNVCIEMSPELQDVIDRLEINNNLTLFFTDGRFGEYENLVKG